MDRPVQPDKANQKLIRALTCSLRGRLACVVKVPKLAESTFAAGAPKKTELVTLKASVCKVRR